MGKLLAVVRREYMERVRSKWFLFATVFGPVLFGAFMFGPPLLAHRSEENSDVRRIAVLDATGTDVGRRVAAELSGGLTGDPSLTRVIPTTPAGLAAAEREATTAVMRGEVKGYLVLDARTMAGERARYAGVNATALGDMRRIERAVEHEVLAARLVEAGVDALRSQSLSRASVELETERLTARGRGGSAQLNAIFAVTIAVLLYLSIFLYGQSVLRGVMEEKQSRVAEVVLSSIRAHTLLTGKVLGVGAVGLTQIAVWSAISYALFRVRAPILQRLGVEATEVALPALGVGQALVLLAFFVLGYLLYAGLFAAVGAMVSSEQEAQQAQTPVVMLLVASIAFAQSVLAQPDGTMARVLSVLPFSAPVMMPLRMSVGQVSPGDVALSLVSVAAGAYVTVWAAARIYRVGLLMYGKQPTLREALRWIGRSA